MTRGRSAWVSRAMISAVERGRHLPGLEVLLTLSQVLHIAPTEVLERLELARARSIETAGLSWDELDRKASESFWAGDPRTAVACYEAMLRMLQQDPPPDDRQRTRLVATTELRRGSALRRCGATAAARAGIERAIAIADGIPEIQVEGYLVLTALLIQLGCLPLARDAAARSVELADECGTAKLRGWAWIEKGQVLHASGRPAEALDAFRQAREWVREAEDHAHAVKVEGNIGACFCDLGRYEQARRRYLDAVELARKHRQPASEAFWLLEVGRVGYLQERLDQADSYAQASLRIAKPKELLLTCFRGEWLRHLVQRARHPGDRDRHRVAYLKKLFVRLEEHRGIEEIQEFKRAYGSTSRGR